MIAVTPSQMAKNLKVMNTQFMVFALAQDEEIKKFLLDEAGLKEPK